MSPRSPALPVGILLAFAALLSACATPKPDIRVHSAPNAQFSAYSTFGFPEQTGTDRGGYSTLVTQYFEEALRQQLERRGYRYVDQNPDLLVNFFANVRERTEVRSYPGFAYGYYGYRYGLYSPWPLYGPEYDVVTYPVGTANIDIVDAKRRQLIWEGIAQGRISDADMDRPREAIANVVDEVMQRFPGRAAPSPDTSTSPPAS